MKHWEDDVPPRARQMFIEPAFINYVPPPPEFAALVVRVVAGPSTPFTDHLIQSNAERRRYPARETRYA